METSKGSRFGRSKSSHSNQELVDFLLKHKANKFELTFKSVAEDVANVKSKGKKENIKPYTVDEASVANWIVDSLITSIRNQTFPLGLSHQLFGSKIKYNEKQGREVMYFHDDAYFDYHRQDSLKADALVEMSVPLINYYNMKLT